MADFSQVSLLIVDLDNTLCDTYHSLSIPQWERVERRLIELGAREEAQVLKESFGARSFRDALLASGLSKEAMDEAIARYDEVDVSQIRLFPDARAILDLPMDKVLLSRGEERLQREKIARLGIAERFTDIVIVPTFEEKGPALRATMERYGKRPAECLVIGDRLLEEIKDGLALGMPAALVLRPGLPVPESDIEPTLTVDSLEEVARALQQR